jgi:hypothetical protein
MRARQATTNFGGREASLGRGRLERLRTGNLGLISLGMRLQGQVLGNGKWEADIAHLGGGRR